MTLALLLQTGSLVAHAALLGDVNGDGRVTIADAVQLLGALVRQENPTPRERVLGNMTLTESPPAVLPSASSEAPNPSVRDVSAILRVAVGLSPARDVGPVVIDLTGTPDVADPFDNNSVVWDGPASDVTLYDPWDLVVSPTGDVYFTEWSGDRVRVLDGHGMVRTIAGTTRPHDGSYYDFFLDGVGPDAHFHELMGIAFLPDGSLAVADSLDYAIRKVTLDGVVTTIAGGVRGYRDANGRDAQMSEPNGIATDPAGNIYVTDTWNERIRKIDPAGNVTTIAGDGTAGFRDGPALQARFNYPTGVAYDPKDGGVFVADMSNHSIRKIGADGIVTTVAGSGKPGYSDGYGSKVRFKNPYGVDLDSNRRLWIADWTNELVRVMEPDGRVWTYAGSFPAGHLEGPARSAKFYGLMNVRVGRDGAVYMAETDNERLGVVLP